MLKNKKHSTALITQQYYSLLQKNVANGSFNFRYFGTLLFDDILMTETLAKLTLLY